MVLASCLSSAAGAWCKERIGACRAAVDLTRAGLAKVIQGLSSVQTDGLLPTLDYSEQGGPQSRDPDSQAQRDRRGRPGAGCRRSSKIRPWALVEK
jgi:hypothetical protein